MKKMDSQTSSDAPTGRVTRSQAKRSDTNSSIQEMMSGEANENTHSGGDSSNADDTSNTLTVEIPGSSSSDLPRSRRSKTGSGKQLVKSKTSEKSPKSKSKDGAKSRGKSKQAANSAKASDDNKDTDNPEPPSSPEPNCMICLGKVKNKSFTDACCHICCYTCLKKWAVTRPVCPLCRKKFTKINHSFKSMDNFKVHNLFDAHTVHDVDDDDDESHNDASIFDMVAPVQAGDVVLGMWNNSQTSSQTHNSCATLERDAWRRDFRRCVYRTGMRVTELRSPVDGSVLQYRTDLTPAVIAADWNLIRRLSRWVRWELELLLPDVDAHGVLEVRDFVRDLAISFDILSEEFSEHLRPYLSSELIGHFIHEFRSFVCAPAEAVLAGYDLCAVYEHELAPQDISSDDDSDVEIVLESSHDTTRSRQSDQNSTPRRISLLELSDIPGPSNRDINDLLRERSIWRPWNRHGSDFVNLELPAQNSSDDVAIEVPAPNQTSDVSEPLAHCSRAEADFNDDKINDDSVIVCENEKKQSESDADVEKSDINITDSLLSNDLLPSSSSVSQRSNYLSNLSEVPIYQNSTPRRISLLELSDIPGPSNRDINDLLRERSIWRPWNRHGSDFVNLELPAQNSSDDVAIEVPAPNQTSDVSEPLAHCSRAEADFNDDKINDDSVIVCENEKKQSESDADVEKSDINITDSLLSNDLLPSSSSVSQRSNYLSNLSEVPTGMSYNDLTVYLTRSSELDSVLPVDREKEDFTELSDTDSDILVTRIESKRSKSSICLLSSSEDELNEQKLKNKKMRKKKKRGMNDNSVADDSEMCDVDKHCSSNDGKQCSKLDDDQATVSCKECGNAEIYESVCSTSDKANNIESMPEGCFSGKDLTNSLECSDLSVDNPTKLLNTQVQKDKIGSSIVPGGSSSSSVKSIANRPYLNWPKKLQAFRDSKSGTSFCDKEISEASLGDTGSGQTVSDECLHRREIEDIEKPHINNIPHRCRCGRLISSFESTADIILSEPPDSSESSEPLFLARSLTNDNSRIDLCNSELFSSDVRQFNSSADVRYMGMSKRRRAEVHSCDSDSSDEVQVISDSRSSRVRRKRRRRSAAVVNTASDSESELIADATNNSHNAIRPVVIGDRLVEESRRTIRDSHELDHPPRSNSSAVIQGKFKKHHSGHKKSSKNLASITSSSLSDVPSTSAAVSVLNSDSVQQRDIVTNEVNAPEVSTCTNDQSNIVSDKISEETSSAENNESSITVILTQTSTERIESSETNRTDEVTGSSTSSSTEAQSTLHEDQCDVVSECCHPDLESETPRFDEDNINQTCNDRICDTTENRSDVDNKSCLENEASSCVDVLSGILYESNQVINESEELNCSSSNKSTAPGYNNNNSSDFDRTENEGSTLCDIPAINSTCSDNTTAEQASTVEHNDSEMSRYNKKEYGNSSSVESDEPGINRVDADECVEYLLDSDSDVDVLDHVRVGQTSAEAIALESDNSVRCVDDLYEENDLVAVSSSVDDCTPGTSSGTSRAYRRRNRGKSGVTLILSDSSDDSFDDDFLPSYMTISRATADQMYDQIFSSQEPEQEVEPEQDFIPSEASFGGISGTVQTEINCDENDFLPSRLDSCISESIGSGEIMDVEVNHSHQTSFTDTLTPHCVTSDSISQEPHDAVESPTSSTYDEIHE